MSRRLRHLIVVPYLVLATLMALIVTYLLMSTANQSLTDRFNMQLLDAAQGGATRLAQAETQQLQALRAIAFTQGFVEAITGKDSAALTTLAAPQAANYDVDSVLVVSRDYKTLLSLSGQAGTGPASVSDANGPEMDALVRAALNPTGDLDKVTSVVAGRDGGESVFYTAGPVRQGEEIVGAVLIGSNLPRMLRQIGRDSLSDGVTFYTQGGVPVGHQLVTSQQDVAISALPGTWFEEISKGAGKGIRVRTVALAGESYVEAFGAIPGRGLEGQPPGVYGVMLRTRSLDARLEQTLWAMLPIFALGLALIVAIGIALASWIDKPLAQLMDASGHVARGDLEVRVPVTRNDELGVLTTRFNDMVGGLRQLLFVKDMFGRFVSPEVSAKLLAGQIELGGEQREVTILFSDLRDFTELSEERSPTEIVDLLNEYFRVVVRAAGRHGGIVNKFGGDSTLIIFGAPVDMMDHADRALATALEMSETLEELSAKRMQSGWKPLRQGIGINTGTVVAGQVGSEDRMEYTVIGNAVNVASRLQAMTKSMKGHGILFSGNTMDALTAPDEWLWESKGQVELRGKQEAVKIYSLLKEVDFQIETIQVEVSTQRNKPEADEILDPDMIVLEARGRG